MLLNNSNNADDDDDHKLTKRDQHASSRGLTMSVFGGCRCREWTTHMLADYLRLSVWVMAAGWLGVLL